MESGRMPKTKSPDAKQQGGSSRVISAADLQSDHKFIGERVVETEVVRPKRVLTSEIVEKAVVVPEVRQVEEMSEDVIRVRERIVEVAKPIMQEKVVEVQEVEYYETSVEFPETVHEAHIKEVPRVTVEEEVVQVPRLILVEKIVEVPEIEYQEIPVEKIVQITEYEDEVVTREVPVDEYVEVPVHQDKLVDVVKDFEMKIPKPVEAVTEWRFRMPVVKPLRQTVHIDLRVPRFIEVPVPSAYLSDEEFATAQNLYNRLQELISTPHPSLTDIEAIANTAVEEHKNIVRLPDEETTLLEIEAKLRRHLRTVDTGVVVPPPPAPPSPALSGTTGAGRLSSAAYAS